MAKEYINIKELTQDNGKTLHIFTGNRGNKPHKWSIVGLNTGVIYYQSYDQELCLSLACRIKSEYRETKGKELMLGVI